MITTANHQAVDPLTAEELQALDALRPRIEAYLARYPNKQAVTLPALHLIHDELRYVPREGIRMIADILDLSPAEVHDTMSFYNFFRERKDSRLGRTRLWVCRSLACALRGGEELLRLCSEKLHIAPGGTSTDGSITLEFAECLGGCEGAPCLLINDEHRLGVTPKVLDDILAELHGGGSGPSS